MDEAHWRGSLALADQAQALTLPLAKVLSERLDAAVSWQLVAQSGVNAAQASEMLAQAQLQPADVVVIVLGVNDVGSQTRTGTNTIMRWLAAPC